MKMMYITFFWTIVLLVYVIIMLIFKGKVKSKKINYTIKSSDKKEAPRTAYNRIITPILEDVKIKFRRKLTGEKFDKLELKLLKAGNPFEWSPVEFRLVQITMIILFIIIFYFLGVISSNDLTSIFIIIFIGFILGIFLPNYYLKQKITMRNRESLKELPDVVDLLTVSLEAGLGFDLALHKLVARKSGIITSEFKRCLEEIRLGKSRRNAFKGITERLKVEELNTLINSILQAEKLGISMVKVLRIQSVEIREKRRQRAEEQAAKAPIKMLFPLIFLIFPALFIVVLGPALIKFMEVFK